jgi:hypothetical protein
MQAVDSSKLSLVAFRRRAGFASKTRASLRRRRDVEKSLGTVFWFHSLCRLKGAKGAAELEREFDPRERRERVDGTRRQNNKWPGYSKGQHEPRQILEAVEKACPGANASLKSMLWPALAAGQMPTRQIRALLSGLPASLQVLIRRHHYWPGSKTAPRKANAKMLASALERRAGLDALGATLLLLRLTHAAGEDEAAYEWGSRVWRMMVLLGPDFVAGGIARPLAELIEERIMPMASMQGMHMGFPEGGYFRVVEAFAKVRETQRRHSLPASATEWQCKAIGPQLLECKLGSDCHYAFNPMPMPMPMLGADIDRLALTGPAVRESRCSAENRFCHEWALNMLSIGGHPNSPPMAVYRGEDLWAEDPSDRHVAFRARARAQRTTA